MLWSKPVRNMLRDIKRGKRHFSHCQFLPRSMLMQTGTLEFINQNMALTDTLFCCRQYDHLQMAGQSIAILIWLFMRLHITNCKQRGLSNKVADKTTYPILIDWEAHSCLANSGTHQKHRGRFVKLCYRSLLAGKIVHENKPSQLDWCPLCK